MAGHSKFLDLLLVGKTGTGKSATGNSILQKKAFEASAAMASVTQKMQFDFGKFLDFVLKVVDAPGIGDTILSTENAIRTVVEAMTKAIAANPEGYHAILIVVRYGSRFTAEDVKSVQILKDIFGDEFIKYHAILLLTCGDMFKSDYANSNISVEEWCKTQDGPFKELFEECGGRVVLFDNMTQDKRQINDQIQHLLERVSGLTKDCQRYTNQLFDKAKQTREELIIKASVPRLFEEVLREIAIITQELVGIDFGNPEPELKRLNLQMEKLDKLHEKIVNEAQGSNALDSVKQLVEKVRIPFAEQLESMTEAARLKQKVEDLGKQMMLDTDGARSSGQPNQNVMGQMQGRSRDTEEEMPCIGAERDVRVRGRDTQSQHEPSQSRHGNPLGITQSQGRDDGRRCEEQYERASDRLKQLQQNREREVKLKSQVSDLEKDYKTIKEKLGKSLWNKIVDAIMMPIHRFRRWFEDTS